MLARTLGFAFFLLVVAVGLTPQAEAQNQVPPSVKLGMLQNMFRDVPPVIVTAVAKPFRDLFRRQTGLEGNVELVKDYTLLVDKMNSKSLDIGVFHGFEFAWIREKNPDIKPIVVTVPPGRKVQACIVVKKDSKATSATDLIDDCIMHPTGLKAHCLLYNDHLLATLPRNCCRPAKHGPMSPEAVLDAIVNGESTAALVDLSSLNAYESSKPGAFRELRVVCKSEDFPPAVIAYRVGSIDPAAVKKIREGLIRSTNTAQGRAFLMLWNLDGFEDVPADFEASLKRSAKAYPQPVVVKGPDGKSSIEK